MFLKLNFQALFVGRLDNSVQWTAQYPGDRAVYFAISYSLLQCLHLPPYPFLLNLPLHPLHLSILTTPLLHTPPPPPCPFFFYLQYYNHLVRSKVNLRLRFSYFFLTLFFSFTKICLFLVCCSSVSFELFHESLKANKKYTRLPANKILVSGH